MMTDRVLLEALYPTIRFVCIEINDVSVVE